MDRRVAPPKQVTSPTRSPPPPCKQGLSLYIYKTCILDLFCESPLNTHTRIVRREQGPMSTHGLLGVRSNRRVPLYLKFVFMYD